VSSGVRAVFAAFTAILEEQALWQTCNCYREDFEAHNLLADYQASLEFYVKFIQPSFDPLVIERHGEQVVVGHYFIQNGDVMAIRNRP
jgi:hypothetical protein